MLKVGFIKGGQLGKMLLEAAPAFDIRTFVLDNDPNCPCHNLCDQLVLGDESLFDDVYAFGKMVDILTFEYEHINIEALKKLKAEGLTIFPDPSILEMVQDKGKQKEFYKTNGIPTSEFRLINGRKDLESMMVFLPAVQKTRRAGYDGKGVHKINSADDLANAFDEPSVLEKFVDFDKEIAVIAARNDKGETVVYPTVEMVFHPTKNLVEFLASPANIKDEVNQEARGIALQLVQALGIVGVLAVEMFVTKDGRVLVNEVAPRVHNSGHHSIEGNITSQFMQHLRCILGMKPGSSEINSPAVMVNILGTPGFEGPARYEGLDVAHALGGVYVHLYNKAITKPFRKMGHATVIDSNVNNALIKARQVKDIIKVKA
jgi:5-(carboxyamino)imidazole ribonucleotide synthase